MIIPPIIIRTQIIRTTAGLIAGPGSGAHGIGAGAEDGPVGMGEEDGTGPGEAVGTVARSAAGTEAGAVARTEDGAGMVDLVAAGMVADTVASTEVGIIDGRLENGR